MLGRTPRSPALISSGSASSSPADSVERRIRHILDFALCIHPGDEAEILSYVETGRMTRRRCRALCEARDGWHARHRREGFA